MRMKVISSVIYQYGKVSTISSRIVKEEEDNKLLLARDEVYILADEYLVDVFLCDSWYCKSPLLEKIRGREKVFISRLRTDSSVKQEGKKRKESKQSVGKIIF